MSNDQKKKWHEFGVRLSPETMASMEKISERTEAKVAALVRRAVKEFVAREELNQAEKAESDR